ncbi:MAG: 3-phosphoshikimate 1-carboxyvinyltransferase [Theionarchaea archaeon]|nr:3-phosphoshikimate 1-carboxyvinyltransferase [Theionarchaea archaeon]MBU7001243.1 3-phosphoshikimate 1-carboxyvinyltransferase [Theionarchaea archaeon]MBU7019852.1 3-phosphoshikimate 1-carboxyvinyltransferase [Theionarchaea archaeon]MBU7035738.1 3-phosphoshikimate 1-carboxyvinyltransferase [Theionarchaea archaeon]MBU7041510.1 3-phosphoshikimate 1-carboxyvinyltransferase [Theionarchaea archaeon]
MNMTIHHGISGGTVYAPPSKSYTHRAILMSALAEGTSLLINPLHSQDTQRTFSAVQALGAYVSGNTITGNLLKANGEIIDCGGSGTTLRLLMGVTSLLDGKTCFTGNQSLRRRPMEPLLTALKSLGAHILSTHGTLPIVTCGGLTGGAVTVNCEKSSQFLSSLLLSLPLAAEDSVVTAESLRSRPYVDITLEMLAEFGIRIEKEANIYYVPGNQSYRSQSICISGDFSSAAYFMTAGAITGAPVRIENIDLNSAQGDTYILEVMKKMGADVTSIPSQRAVVVAGGELRGIPIDCSDIPDLFPVLCVLGMCAEGTTTLYNAPHLHYKESDRIANMALELTALGITTQVLEDGLIIQGGIPKKWVTVHSHRDHRVCMALSIAALVSDGITITDTACISESYPAFFDDIKAIGGHVE